MRSATTPAVLPEAIRAVIFDMDGVITDTASAHAEAWKRMFDEHLRRHAERSGEAFVPFDADEDYRRYIDGRPRFDGVRGFLASRGIELPGGDPDDPPDRETVGGLGNRKNEMFLEHLRAQGVEAYPSTVALVRELQTRGLGTAAISASRNMSEVLDAAGVGDLFAITVDGLVLDELGLPGKPDPAVFVEAARRLGVEPSRAAVVEDALAGVEAGARGGFGYVVGVDRTGHADALRAAGADVVVSDLAELRLGRGPIRDPASEPGAAGRGPRGAKTGVDGWTLRYEGIDPAEEGLREALCTLGNGAFATRGAAPEAVADDVHYPGTYAAGVYDRLRTEVAGRSVENEDLVNLPNWLVLTFRQEGGDWLDLGRIEVLSFEQELDLRAGVLQRSFRVRDADGRTTAVRQRRLVSMAEPRLAALETTIVAEDWSGRLEVRSGLDGTVTNAGVARYRSLRGDHLVPVSTGVVAGDAISLVAETRDSHLRIAVAARTLVFRGDEPFEHERTVIDGEGTIAHELAFEVRRGQEITIDKVAALVTGKANAIYEPGAEAAKAVERAGTFDTLLGRHALAWEQLWQRFDMAIEGHERAQTILRLHLFHLLQTVSLNTIDLDVGVPARGLHGEAYRGHVFWDELFVFPLLTYRLPVLTRALLNYRFRRLGQARWAASEAGFEGAMYPWQSGSDGREESQTLHLNPRSGRWLPDHSRLQRHVGIAVAYNAWHYFQVSEDVEFLRFRGAPMLIEVARFWASVATFDETKGRHVIRGVMGPDEYHDGYPDRDEPGVDNNAYTNVMVVWLLCRTLELLERLPEHHRRELWGTFGLSREELDRWQDISRTMFVPFDGEIISQFEGYGELAELDRDGLRVRYADISRMDRILEAEGDTANRYQVSKQADVLMLFYLLSADELRGLLERLGYELGADAIAKNVDHYLARTSHGSTLSRIVHSWVLARSDRERSWELFSQALESDVADTQGGTTPEGIHLGAMAGTVDLIQRGYTGLEARGDVLWFDPALPEELKAVEFRVHYRGHRLQVRVTPERIRLGTLPSEVAPIQVGFGGEVVELGPGSTVDWSLAEER